MTNEDELTEPTPADDRRHLVNLDFDPFDDSDSDDDVAMFEPADIPD